MCCRWVVKCSRGFAAGLLAKTAWLAGDGTDRRPLGCWGSREMPWVNSSLSVVEAKAVDIVCSFEENFMDGERKYHGLGLRKRARNGNGRMTQGVSI